MFTFITVLLCAGVAVYAVKAKDDLLGAVAPRTRRRLRNLPRVSRRRGTERPVRRRTGIDAIAEQIVCDIVDGMQSTMYTAEVLARDSAFVLHCHPEVYPLVEQFFDAVVRDVLCGIDDECARRNIPTPRVDLERVCSDPKQSRDAVAVLTRAESKAQHAALSQKKDEERLQRERRAARQAPIAAYRLVKLLGEGPDLIELALGRNVLGRHPECGIGQIVVATISREHASIELTEDGRAFLVDAGSKHGTVLDGVALAAGTEVALNHDAVVELGSKVSYRFEIAAPAIMMTED